MIDNKTKIIIGLIIVAIIGLFVGNKIYNDNDYLALVLVCELNSKYTNYEEKLEFSYVDKTLYEYKRNEIMSSTEKTSLEEIKKLFNDQYNKLQEHFNDNFHYDVKVTDSSVQAETYIKTLFNEDFYNSYIKEKEIDMDSSIDEVEEKLSGEYTCQREKRG